MPDVGISSAYAVAKVVFLLMLKLLQAMYQVSIIICTRDRASHLQKTLESVSTVSVPANLATEMIIVDNGSKDNTREVVDACTMPNLQLRYIFEPNSGKVVAQNTALAVAQGDVLLWTDDDVRLPADWIDRMCHPILTGMADGVSGRIKMAPHLERPWMARTHYVRLADTRFLPEASNSLIGANMSFHRRVLAHIPGFDTELGPGALGFMDDTLFGYQMLEAGFNIIAAPFIEVEHHFDPLRLSRISWLRHAQASGRSSAYIEHHWRHNAVSAARLRLTAWQAALALFRLRFRPAPLDAEGCDWKEIRLVQNIAFLRQYVKEQITAPKYDRHGLIKRQFQGRP